MKKMLVITICVAIAASFAVAGHAEDSVTVVLSHHNLSPERIQVHVGDIVIWRSARGEQIELRFDFHPQAHDVTSRSSEVHAFFRKPGEHAYSGRIKDGQRFHGLVLVRERAEAPSPSRRGECDASNTLCIVP